MKKSKVVLDFIKFSIAEKIAFFRNVVKLMTGNTLFAKPDVALTDLTPIVDTLETDYTAAKSGSHAMVAVMNQSEKNADNAFRKLALYVDRFFTHHKHKVQVATTPQGSTFERTTSSLFVIYIARVSLVS